ncbi:MAG: hypothetical protein AB1489_06355 [Acidobacteriota bacterium]
MSMSAETGLLEVTKQDTRPKTEAPSQLSQQSSSLPQAINEDANTEAFEIGRGLMAVVGGGVTLVYLLFLACIYFAPYLIEIPVPLFVLSVFAVIALGAFITIKWVDYSFKG